MHLYFQKWQDILKEVKFLKDTKHENCIQYKGGYLKDQNCWVCVIWYHVRYILRGDEVGKLSKTTLF